MTDELYDYFGGNASKKVEPIEDDEMDVPQDEESANEETQNLADDAVEEPVAASDAL